MYTPWTIEIEHTHNIHYARMHHTPVRSKLITANVYIYTALIFFPHREEREREEEEEEPLSLSLSFLYTRKTRICQIHNPLLIWNEIIYHHRRGAWDSENTIPVFQLVKYRQQQIIKKHKGYAYYQETCFIAVLGVLPNLLPPPLRKERRKREK